MSYTKILSDIGQNLADAQGLQSGLKKILDVARQHQCFSRSYVILQNSRTAKISVSVSDGLSAVEFRRLENRLEKDFLKTFFEKGERTFVKEYRPKVFLISSPRVMMKRVFWACR